MRVVAGWLLGARCASPEFCGLGLDFTLGRGRALVQFDSQWLESVPSRSPSLPDERRFEEERRRLLEVTDDDRIVRAWRWWLALSAAPPDALAELAREVPDAARIGVGFSEEHEGRFGVIVTSESRVSGPQDEAGEGLESEWQDRSDYRPPLGVLSTDDGRLPVFARYVDVEQHWCTAPFVSYPTNARAACRVRSIPRAYEGWLVPRHATRGPRSLVRIDGIDQAVVDSFGACIDSVVVSADPGGWGPPVAPSWPLSPGQAISVTTGMGTSVDSTILDLDLNFGLLRVAAFPLRMSTTWTGAPGDSGSLIIDDLEQPAAMYLGACTPSSLIGQGPAATVSPFGYAQVLYQLHQAGGLEFAHA